jgi:hypothetical protein
MHGNMNVKYQVNLTSTLALFFNASKIMFTLHTACHNLWKSPATCAHSTQTCGRDGGHYATHLNNPTTKLQLSQCYKFKLFSLSHPGAVRGRKNYTMVHHSHYDIVRILSTILSHSDATCDRNKYTVVHHSPHDIARLWSNVLSYPEAICGRDKYTVVHHSPLDNVRLWSTVLS